MREIIFLDEEYLTLDEGKLAQLYVKHGIKKGIKRAGKAAYKPYSKQDVQNITRGAVAGELAFGGAGIAATASGVNNPAVLALPFAGAVLGAAGPAIAAHRRKSKLHKAAKNVVADDADLQSKISSLQSDAETTRNPFKLRNRLKELGSDMATRAPKITERYIDDEYDEDRHKIESKTAEKIEGLERKRKIEKAKHL